MKLCLVCNFQFEDEQELCPKDYSKLVPLGKDQLIGKVIQDRYRIDSIIAKGSMGVIYKATQELIGREVAIKVLHGYLVDDEESIKRFHKEAKAASRLNHPNITTLYDYGVLGRGQPYIIMDLLRGASLADILKRRDYLPLDEALVIFRQVCDALGEAHKCGVVHRDIKPENIMMDYTDKGVAVKVVDFGIAKFLQGQDDTIGKITKTGTVCGSPTYMSPEQCDDNPVDHRSDLYSLGVVLYETITGRVPFSHKDIYNVMTMQVKEPPPRLKVMRPDLDFPAYLQAVIDKAMAKAPADRFQSAEEFFNGLQGKPAALGSGSSANISSGIRSGFLPAENGQRIAQAAIAEDTASSVVTRALQKKLAQAGEYFTEQAEVSDSGSRPVVNSEAVKKKVQAVTQELLVRRSQQPDLVHNVAPTGVSPAMRLIGFIQQAFPAVLTMALAIILFIVVGNSSQIRAFVDSHSKYLTGEAGISNFAAADIDDLLAQGKYEQVKTILEKRKKEGKLDDESLASLNSVYTRLAKREAKARHYKAAVALLDQVSGEDRSDGEFKALMKKYKRYAGSR